MTKLITVHGTGAGSGQDDGELWWQKGSPFLGRLSGVINLSHVDVVQFHWDIGANSETARRNAGKRLYQLLKGFDESGEDYYVIGHSHGGSVTYNALLHSVQIGRPLRRLQAWCTIGTPFIDLAPKRFLISRLDAPGLAVFTLGVALVFALLVLIVSHLIGTEVTREIDEQLKGTALGHLYLPMLGTACILAFASYAALYAYERFMNRWISDRVKQRTAELYAGSWIGLTHADDEAIASLRAASQFKPQIVPRNFLAQGFALIPVGLLFTGLLALLWKLEGNLLKPVDQLKAFSTTLEKIKPQKLDQSLIEILPGFSGLAWWLALLAATLVIASVVVYVFKLIGHAVGRPVAAAVDRLVWASVREQVWGDDLPAEYVRGVSSHPPMFAPRYKPLPASIAAPVADLSNLSAGETLRKLRGNLGMSTTTSRSGDFLGSALMVLNWRELIHTAYFDIDEFVRLVAFALHRQGMAGLKPGSWTSEQRTAARDAYSAMIISQVLHAGEVERVGSGKVVARSNSLDLSVSQKTLVSVAMVGGVFVVGTLLTCLVLPWHWAALIWLGGAVATVVLAQILPVSIRGLDSSPQPARSFEEARQRFDAWHNMPEATVHPRCVPYLLSHGKRTPRSYVLVHGISNCPYSMVDFAPKLHALGHNVLVVRMPQNGHLDNSTDALRHLTAKDLRAFSDQSIDIAAGLGERVHVIGISAGGVIAGWMAQNRGEIDRAVLLAPAYGLSSFGTGLNNALMRLILLMPNFSVWKDPILRADAENRPHSYKRQATRGMGEVMRLGLATVRQSKAAKPRAVAITLVTNAADAAVDPTMPEALAKVWEQHAVPVTRYVFPKEFNLPHELIDPTEEGSNIAMSHPKIIELSERMPEVPRPNVSGRGDRVA